VTRTAAPAVEAVAPVTETVTQTATPVVAVAAPVTEALSPEAVLPAIEAAAQVTQTVTRTAAPAVEAVAPVTETVTQTATPVVAAAAPVTEALSPEAVLPAIEAAAQVTQTVTQTIVPVASPIRVVDELSPVLPTLSGPVVPIEDRFTVGVDTVVEQSLSPSNQVASALPLFVSVSSAPVTSTPGGSSRSALATSPIRIAPPSNPNANADSTATFDLASDMGLMTAGVWGAPGEPTQRDSEIGETIVSQQPVGTAQASERGREREPSMPDAFFGWFSAFFGFTGVQLVRLLAFACTLFMCGAAFLFAGRRIARH
jgi:hypothetical protein